MTIKQEVVYRVRKTAKGCKVDRLNGTALADGIYSKGRARYFYGEDADEKANNYARNRAEEDDNVRAVELGERW